VAEEQPSHFCTSSATESLFKETLACVNVALFPVFTDENVCLLCLHQQVRTTDLGGYATRTDFTQAVIANLNTV